MTLKTGPAISFAVERARAFEASLRRRGVVQHHPLVGVELRERREERRIDRVVVPAFLVGQPCGRDRPDDARGVDRRLSNDRRRHEGGKQNRHDRRDGQHAEDGTRAVHETRLVLTSDAARWSLPYE